MHTHKQTNNYAQLQILYTHADIHADNTYVHLNKYIHIAEHTYRDIQIHSFIHEHIQKNSTIFSRKNIFTVKKLFK